MSFDDVKEHEREQAQRRAEQKVNAIYPLTGRTHLFILQS